jgi:LacI family transcriptional regulator
MQRIKLTDVAAAAGVHPGTASRALNPATRDQVSPETSRRVVRAAERLGYVPNALAKGLRTARSYIIAMIVPDVTNPLFPPMVRGAERILSDAGYIVVLTDTDNDAASERRQVEQLRARGVDGFIIATARWKDPLLDELADGGIPAVLVNRNTASARLPYVGADERTGVRLAVEHLVALGHRGIAYLAGPQDTSTGRVRLAEFRQTIRRLGLPARLCPVVVCDAYTEPAGAEAGRRLLTAHGKPTAILAGNDLIAFGALATLTAAGLRCPDQVSVIGFNDLPMLDLLTPALTTVRLPLTDMGELAARALLSEIDGQSSRGSVTSTLLTVGLALRASTAPPSRAAATAPRPRSLGTHRAAQNAS